MRKKLSVTILLALAILAGGCATAYRPISPSTLNYSSNDFKDGIGLSYKYDVLRERGNKKYANKEYNKEIKIIAVKVTNNTDTVLNLGRDALFYSGQNQITPMDPNVVKSTIRQVTPGYLPYLFLTFTNLYVTNGTTTKNYPIGLVLGPGITFGNMINASSANKQMLEEFNEFNIIGRDIQKGETIFGIIGLRTTGYEPISIRMTD